MTQRNGFEMVWRFKAMDFIHKLLLGAGIESGKSKVKYWILAVIIESFEPCQNLNLLIPKFTAWKYPLDTFKKQ